MPDYKFSATLTEVSEIIVRIEADSEKEARKLIRNRDFDWEKEARKLIRNRNFDWEEQTKHQDYISHEISDITLEERD